MIEQGLYFGLGCVVTGLVSLGLFPILWARALRLTRQRLQVQIPVSMQEILADRDQLRAEFAVERRKLEQEMERVRAGKAGDMAELGRRAVHASALADELAAVRKIEAAQETEIATLLREAAETGGQVGALRMALDQTHGYFEQRLADHQALRRAHQTLEDVVEAQRTTVAALDTRAMGLEMTIEDATRARAAIERQLDVSKQNARLLTDERDLLSKRIDVMQASHDTLRARLAAEASKAAILVEAGQVAQGELDKARARTRALDAALAEAGRAIDEAKEREKSIHLQKSLQAEKARGENRAVLDRLDVLQAENAALHGALEAARRHGGPASGREQPDKDAPSRNAVDGVLDAEAALLRSSIHAMGLAVAQATLAAKGPALGKAADRPSLVATNEE